MRLKYNEPKPKLISVDDLDQLIKDITYELTDNGFQLEAMHQNGYTTYQIYKPEYSRMSDVSDFLNKEKNLMKMYNDRFFDDFNIYLETMSNLNKSLVEIRDRVVGIIGLEEFSINQIGMISISFKHKDQGYGNLGSVMLVGNGSNRVYYH